MWSASSIIRSARGASAGPSQTLWWFRWRTITTIPIGTRFMKSSRSRSRWKQMRRLTISQEKNTTLISASCLRMNWSSCKETQRLSETSGWISRVASSNQTLKRMSDSPQLRASKRSLLKGKSCGIFHGSTRPGRMEMMSMKKRTCQSSTTATPICSSMRWRVDCTLLKRTLWTWKEDLLSSWTWKKLR